MSAEIITVILTAAVLMVTIVGGIFASSAWLLRRMDERFEKVDQRFDKMDQRFDKVDRQFEKVDQRFEKVDQEFKGIGARIGEFRAELNDVNVAVARLEGPYPRLKLPPR